MCYIITILKHEGSFSVISSITNLITSVTLASSLLTGDPSAGVTKPIQPVKQVITQNSEEGNAYVGLMKVQNIEKGAKEQASKHRKVNWPIIPNPKQKPKPKSVVKPAPKAPTPTYRDVTVRATAYTAHCSEGCTGKTATGINLDENPNIKLIAVDPSVIPLGKHVYVPGYGVAITGDTGGAIHGDRIDIYMASEQDALNWGVQTITLKILD